MIDTAEIQGLHNYAGMAASNNGSPDAPINDHIEDGVERRPIAKTYKESTDREKTRKKASRDREVVLREMKETGELLDRSHEVYRMIDRVCYRLKPEVSPEINISLSDSFKAFTLKDKKTIVLSAGLFKELEEYVKTRGKELSEDHIALIIGHEMSHWDEQAKNMHISERYCDTQGLMLVNKAGYNVDNAVEALEYLEFAEERARQEGGLDDEEGTINAGEITHPNSEDRRILIQAMANDPNAYLEGRYSKPTTLNPEIYGDFKHRSEQWLEQVRRREMIASESDIQREFGEARSVSQVLETFMSADNFYHAAMSREFAQTQEFGNVLLAMAVYGEITNNDLTLLNKEDFQAQFRAGLIQTSKTKAEPQQAPTQPRTAEFSTQKDLTPEQIQLIQDCLDGKIQNPLTILSSSRVDLAAKYPQFAGFTFNNFFQGITHDVNLFIQPEISQGGSIVKEAQNLNRARLIGFQGKLEEEAYLGDEINGVTLQVSENRKTLLNQTQYALASALLRFSQTDRSDIFSSGVYSIEHDALPWETRDWGDFVVVSGELVQDMADLGPDYSQLQTQVANSLLRSGACSTQEVANRVSLIVLETGRYLEEAVGFHAPKSLARQRPNLGAYWSDTPETHQDFRNALFRTHVSLAQGGQGLGGAFGRPRIDPFIESWNWSMYFLARDQNNLIGDSLDPYQIIIEGDPAISIPYQDPILDAFRRATGSNIDFVKEMFDQGRLSALRGPKVVCQTTDPEIIRRLILESATNTGSGAGRERRSRIIEAVLNNDQIKTNVPLLRSILEEGVANNSLSPREIYQILEGADDLPLYEDFRQYLDEDSSGDYHKRAFDHLRQELETQGVLLPEIIARFVESGGVIESTSVSYSSNYGAKIIPDSEFGGSRWSPSSGKPYPEHPDFPFSESMQLASRIIEYSQRSDFPHSDKVRQILLDNAAALVRYSEKLEPMLSYGFRASRLEWTGESISSLDDLTERISRMPASSYRDGCLDTVVLMVSTPNHRQNNPTSLDQIKTLFRLYSPRRLRDLDPESEKGSISPSHPLTTLPLRMDSFDLREMYPFRYNPNDHFLGALEQFASLLDSEIGAADTKELIIKLDQVRDAIPHPSSARDYLIERALFPLLNGYEQFAGVTVVEKLSILETAYEAAHTARTKGDLGRQIAEIRLDQIGNSLNFEDGVRIILDTMPTRSTTRDHLILKVLNSTYTSWGQINRAEALLLGNDYQTDESSSATRSIVNEAIGRKIKDMSTEERNELVFFLLDRTKHVLEPEDLTEEFFDDRVLAKLKERIVGTYERTYPGGPRSSEPFFRKIPGTEHVYSPVEFSEETYDKYSHEIRAYLLRRFRGEDTSELRSFFYTNLRPDPNEALQMLDQIELPEILQMAIPDSLNDFLQRQLGGGRTISATSLGPMFVTLNPEDRRQLLYRLCLGNNGFFESRNFSQYGSGILEGFINLSTRTSVPAVGAEQVTQQWSSQEVETAKRVLTTTFESLDAGRRTEVFSRIINLIIDSGGSVSKEQIIKTALTAFGVVGAKVGQMDQLLPEYLRNELGSLKEQIPPIPKTTVAQVLRRSGRDHYYDGLGSTVGAASTATVYLARRRGGTEEDRVIKVLRPDALKHVDSDLNAVRTVVTTLRESEALSVDPTQIIEELKSMIAEEFNPRNERINIQDIEQGRRRPAIKRKALEILKIKQIEAPAKVGVPQVDFAGGAHLEMSRALGFSLAKIEEIKAKSGRGEALTDEETKFVQIDLKATREAIISDFFEQAFTTGVFHTDLHQGNIFIDANGDITEIDHGQVGRERSAQKRRALVEFVVGLARNEPRLVAKAISEFSPNTTTETVQNFLSTQPTANNGLLAATTRFVSDNNIRGSINRFTKAMVNVYPYMRDIDETTLRNIMLPYITDSAVIFDLEKAVPGIIAKPVKETIATRLAPVIDEVSRLDRVRQDPTMKEALDAVLQTSIGAVTIGADIAYLLGKGETIMGVPVPKAIGPIWKVAGLLSGKDKQGRAALTRALKAPSEATKNIRDFREAMMKLRQRYADEKASYTTNKQQIDDALQTFDVGPVQGGANG